MDITVSRCARSGLALFLTSLKETFISRRPGRLGVGALGFLRIDFVGEIATVFCRFGVKLKRSPPPLFLLVLDGDMEALRYRASTICVFSLLSYGAICGRRGEDSGDATNTLLKARYANTCAGVGAALILVSSIAGSLYICMHAQNKLQANPKRLLNVLEGRTKTRAKPTQC